MAASYHYNCTDGRNVVFLPELIPSIQTNKFNFPLHYTLHIYRVHQDIFHVFKHIHNANYIHTNANLNEYVKRCKEAQSKELKYTN